MALPPGTRLGSYEIIPALGAGDMGEVYRARDTKLNRDIALKILPEAFAADGVYNLRSSTGISYAVAPKGDRFLMVRLTADAASSLTVVTNWFAELRRLTSAGPR